MAIPTKEGKYVLRTDASKRAMGAGLFQLQDGEERLIGHFSHKLRSAETRYPTYNRELLAMKQAILHFRYYLHGQHFLVYTDHASIQHILRQRQLSSRQMNLLGVLQQYDYKIKYWPGAKNVVADALSRRPDYNTDQPSIRVMECNVLSADEWVKEIITFYDDNSYFGPIVKLIREDTDVTSRKTQAERKEKYGSLVYERRKRFWMDDSGLLLTKRRGFKGLEEDEHVICIPRGGNLRKRLFFEAHDTEVEGHHGALKSFNTLCAQFFWPRMLASVKSYVEGCDVCH